MLAGSAFAFARQTFSLLRQTLQRAFELSRNLAHSFGDGGLREQISARAFNFNFSSVGAGKFPGVRLFSSPQQQARSDQTSLAAVRLLPASDWHSASISTRRAVSASISAATSPLRFSIVTQLFLLIDALTCLPIASQHCFSRRRASSRQIVFEICALPESLRALLLLVCSDLQQCRVRVR